MRNEFMIAARQAMYRLRNLQISHARMRERAEGRLRVAQERHALSVGRAEMVEARGWMELLAVPGVTIPTAAALMEVSESTVSRWVARYNRGIEDVGGGGSVAAGGPAVVGTPGDGS